MDDLISRQAAIGAVNTALFPKINTAKDAEKALRGLPSAEPEIIRCKDCRWWERESICEGHCLEMDLHHFDEDHYCSFAERRTDETE